MGLDPSLFRFGNVTFESQKYICVKDNAVSAKFLFTYLPLKSRYSNTPFSKLPSWIQRRASKWRSGTWKPTRCLCIESVTSSQCVLLRENPRLFKSSILTKAKSLRNPLFPTPLCFGGGSRRLRWLSLENKQFTTSVWWMLRVDPRKCLIEWARWLSARSWTMTSTLTASGASCWASTRPAISRLDLRCSSITSRGSSNKWSKDTRHALCNSLWQTQTPTTRIRWSLSAKRSSTRRNIASTSWKSVILRQIRKNSKSLPICRWRLMQSETFLCSCRRAKNMAWFSWLPNSATCSSLRQTVALYFIASAFPTSSSSQPCATWWQTEWSASTRPLRCFPSILRKKIWYNSSCRPLTFKMGKRLQ